MTRKSLKMVPLRDREKYNKIISLWNEGYKAPQIAYILSGYTSRDTIYRAIREEKQRLAELEDEANKEEE